MLYLYTDGGLDHRLTYASVQLALIALFHNLNLDILVAGRTAPHNLWRNPVERMMSIVNLGLQCVGIGEDNHYKRFADLYGSTTTDRDCPSFSQPKAKKTLSFSPSKQHVLNVDTMVQCKECNMWRLLFSRKKLSVRDKKQLQDILTDTAYTCGATLEEIDLPDNTTAMSLWKSCTILQI